VIVTVPAFTAVTLPFASTVAIVASDVLHATALFVAFSGVTVAVSVAVVLKTAIVTNTGDLP
jgi:hypothetical protein